MHFESLDMFQCICQHMLVLSFYILANDCKLALYKRHSHHIYRLEAHREIINQILIKTKLKTSVPQFSKDSDHIIRIQ